MQRTLVFTREERLLLIEAATLTAHVTATMQRRLKGLLMQLEFTEGAQGCFPGQELLAAKMGASRFAVMRWVRTLRKLKLLTTNKRRTWAGNRQLDYRVDWPKLREFCTPQQLATIAEKCNSATENATAGCCTAQQRAVAGRNRPYRNKQFKSPSAPPAGVEAREAGGGQEQEAFGKLISEVAECGVDQALPAVNAAHANGCTADEIRAAIAHYRTLAGSGVKPGALYVKLRTMSPGEAANRRFPKAHNGAQANATANRQHAVRQQLQDIQLAELAADTAAREQAEREELEAAHGCKWDALTKAERWQLVEQTGSAKLQKAYQHRPTSPVIRVELLKLLAARAEVLNGHD